MKDNIVSRLLTSLFVLCLFALPLMADESARARAALALAMSAAPSMLERSPESNTHKHEEAPCSSACTCGCNDGLPCQCNESTPRLINHHSPVSMRSPATLVHEQSQVWAPVVYYHTVPTLRFSQSTWGNGGTQCVGSR